MSLVTSIKFLILSLCFDRVTATCQSYGSNYVDGGKYSLSGNTNGIFTANESFTGCASDTARNILINPSGDESDCSSTQLQPDGTIQTFDCSAWTYDTMCSGEWSIIVLSTNGGSFQRDFYLSTPNSTTSAAAKRAEATPTTFSTIVQYSTAPEGSTPAAFADYNAPTTINTIASYSTAPEGSTPAAFAADYTAPTTFNTIASYTTAPEGSTPSAFAAPVTYSSQTTPSAIPTQSKSKSKSSTAPTASAFVPWKGGATPSDYSLNTVKATSTAAAQPTPSVADRVPSGASAEYVQALLDGKTPDEECKKKFVEERKQFLSGSSS